MLGINPSLLPPKGHYFAFFGGQGSITPFLTAIALQYGASPGLIGIIYASLPLFMLIAKPSFGMLADEIQQRKAILMTCVAVMFMSFFCMIFNPQKDAAPETMSKGLVCNANSSSLALCRLSKKEMDEYKSKSGNTYCTFECHTTTSQNQAAAQDLISFTAQVSLNEVVFDSNCSLYPLKNFESANEKMEVPKCENETYTSCEVYCDNNFLGKPEIRTKTTTTRAINSQIIYHWILMVTGFAFMGTAVSLADTIIIGNLPHIGLYGRQRLFGSIGFGLFCMIAGKLVDTFSKRGQPINFKSCFCLALIMGTLDILIISRFTVKRVNKPESIFRHVRRLFVRPETLLFTVAVSCVGFFTGVQWTFLIVYSNILGGSQSLTGLIYGTQCFLGEIPFMFVSNWFITKTGHGHAMTLVLLVFSIRFILYSLIKNPWMILPIETTQGITFGIFFTALATYSSLIAPPSMHATLQGIFQGLFDGLGTGTGSLIGGLVFDAVGGSMMWLVMGIAVGILSIVHGMILVMIKRKCVENLPEQQQPMEVEER